MDSQVNQQRYRLPVLGAAKTGKTAFIRRYLTGSYCQRYRPTIDDIYSRDFFVHGALLSLDIYDTCSMDAEMRQLNVAAGDAFIVLFDVHDVASFKFASDVMTEIQEQRRSDFKDIPIVVVGNKCDIPDKQVHPLTVNAWLTTISSHDNVCYHEASAKTATNIVNVFKSLLRISGFPYHMHTGHNPRDVKQKYGKFGHSESSDSPCKAQLNRIFTIKNFPASAPVHRKRISSLRIKPAVAFVFGANEEMDTLKEESPERQRRCSRVSISSRKVSRISQANMQSPDTPTRKLAISQTSEFTDPATSMVPSKTTPTLSSSGTEESSKTQSSANSESVALEEIKSVEISSKLASSKTSPLLSTEPTLSPAEHQHEKVSSTKSTIIADVGKKSQGPSQQQSVAPTKSLPVHMKSSELPLLQKSASVFNKPIGLLERSRQMMTGVSSHLTRHHSLVRQSARLSVKVKAVGVVAPTDVPDETDCQIS